MSAESAQALLVALLVIAGVRPFFDLPRTNERIRALQAGGYAPDPIRSVLYALLIFVIPALWWAYAAAVDEVLLGFIPTVALASTIFIAFVEAATAVRLNRTQGRTAEKGRGQ